MRLARLLDEARRERMKVSESSARANVPASRVASYFGRHRATAFLLPCCGRGATPAVLRDDVATALLAHVHHMAIAPLPHRIATTTRATHRYGHRCHRHHHRISSETANPSNAASQAVHSEPRRSAV
jgi:hypothetical protein